MKKYVSDRVLREIGGGTAAWAKIIAWSKKPGMLNLGQGFPDFVPEEQMKILKAGVTEALADNVFNQYSPQRGLPSLRNAIADLYHTFYKRVLDPEKEVCVVPSGTSGIYATVQAFVNPGEEVVIFEPFFPWYAPCIRLAGGVPRFIQLKEPGFKINREDCEAAFSDKTKLCILNSPHNPTGRIFDADELAIVADLCKNYDVLCLSDEVYEACIYPGQSHRSISRLEGMQDRTIVLGSASKLLGVTGWRVGWVAGQEDLISAINTSHSYVAYVVLRNFHNINDYHKHPIYESFDPVP